MTIEMGINDLRTINSILADMRRALYIYEKCPVEANLRSLGNVAGLLSERILERRMSRPRTQEKGG